MVHSEYVSSCLDLGGAECDQRFESTTEIRLGSLAIVWVFVRKPKEPSRTFGQEHDVQEDEYG